MRILVVSSYLPYPLFSGGAVRLFNIIKELSKKHKITLVSEIRSNQKEDDIKNVKKFCEEVIVVPRKKQWSIDNILKAGFSTNPFLVVGHTLPEMKKEIVKILSEKKFDLIHVETSYVMQNVPKTYIPIVLVEHNIEYLVYERYMKISRWYLRPFLFIDIQKLKVWERKCWEKATRLIAVSEAEKSRMQSRDVDVVPNGVDIKKFHLPIGRWNSRIDKKEKRILFIGDFKWIQNKKTAEWILKDIWPKIKSKISLPRQMTGGGSKFKVVLWMVGREIPEYLKELGDDSVVFDENAPKETEKIYHRSYLLLSPLTVGGGTSYKILEAMASSTPVVTTNLGIEGITAMDGKEALIGETADVLSDQVILLLSDKEIYKRITDAAFNFVEENFSWDIIVRKLENVYKSVVL